MSALVEPRFALTATWEWAPRAVAIVALVLALAGVVYRAPYVTRYPFVNADEGYYGQLLHSRLDASTSVPDRATGYDSFRFSGASAWPYDVGSLLWGPGHTVARLVTLLWGALLLLVTFGLARELFGWIAGGGAALVLSLSDTFIATSSILRPETAAATLGTAAAWLAWRYAASGRPAWPILLAGALAVSVWQSHAAMTGLAALPLFAVELRADARDRLARLGWFAAGVACGAALYALSHVLPDPATYQAAVRYTRVAYRLPLFDFQLSRVFMDEVFHLGRLLEEQRLLAIVGGLAVLVALLPAAVRRAPTQLLLLGLLANFAWLAVMTGAKLPWYLMAYLPLAAILIGRMLVWPFDATARRLAWPAGVATSLSVVAIAVLVWALAPTDQLGEFSESSKDNYAVLTEELRSVVPPGASVAGDPTYWFALSDRPYRDLRFVLARKFQRQHQIGFEQYLDLDPAVDVVVLSSQGRAFVVDAALLRQVKPILERRGATRLASFKHVGYGTVDVYLIPRESAGGPALDPRGTRALEGR